MGGERDSATDSAIPRQDKMSRAAGKKAKPPRNKSSFIEPLLNKRIAQLVAMSGFRPSPPFQALFTTGR